MVNRSFCFARIKYALSAQAVSATAPDDAPVRWHVGRSQVRTLQIHEASMGQAYGGVQGL